MQHVSRIELCPLAKGRNSGKIAASYVNAHYLSLAFRRGVGDFDGQSHQQIEAFPTPVIPEFRRAEGGSCMEQGHMAAPALVGNMNPTRECQDADFLPGSEGIIAGTSCR